jgi:hypothetical protein
VSEQNVELHRRSVEAFNRRDLKATLASLDPNVEHHPVLSAIGANVYQADALIDLGVSEDTLEPIAS